MAALATVLVATEFQPRLHEGASAGAYPTSFLPARSAGRFVAAASSRCLRDGGRWRNGRGGGDTLGGVVTVAEPPLANSYGR